MREIAIFLHWFAHFLLHAYLYSRQEGQVSFRNVWDFRTVGSMRPEW
jgi:hypothetical protein